VEADPQQCRAGLADFEDKLLKTPLDIRARY